MHFGEQKGSGKEQRCRKAPTPIFKDTCLKTCQERFLCLIPNLWIHSVILLWRPCSFLVLAHLCKSGCCPPQSSDSTSCAQCTQVTLMPATGYRGKPSPCLLVFNAVMSPQSNAHFLLCTSFRPACWMRVAVRMRSWLRTHHFQARCVCWGRSIKLTEKGRLVILLTCLMPLIMLEVLSLVRPNTETFKGNYEAACSSRGWDSVTARETSVKVICNDGKATCKHHTLSSLLPTSLKRRQTDWHKRPCSCNSQGWR